MRRLILICGLVAVAAGPWLAEARAADRLALALAELLDLDLSGFLCDFEMVGSDDSDACLMSRPVEANSRAGLASPTPLSDAPGLLVAELVPPVRLDLARHETTASQFWPRAVTSRRLAWLQSYRF